jgi:Flp pilus assembly pilin Flp
MVMRKLRARDDESGSTLVEFALLSPALMFLVAGAIELGHLTMARAALEGATMAAARQAMTGSCPLTRKERMEQAIRDAMTSFRTTDEEGPTIVVKKYADKIGAVETLEPFTDANGNGEYDEGETYEDINGSMMRDEMGKVGDLGGPGDVVSYTATFNLRTIFTFSSSLFGDAEAVRLTASTVVRNEPIFLGKCA